MTGSNIYKVLMIEEYPKIVCY